MEILGIDMMRRMIGRYKGFRCARMGRASKGAGAVFNGAGDAVANTHFKYLIWGSMGDVDSRKISCDLPLRRLGQNQH